MELREQVAAQYRAVIHLCKALSSVHEQTVQLVEEFYDEPFLRMVGERTAYIMEDLGNILNNMDAVDADEDDWMLPVFEEAHRLFPLAVRDPA